MILTRSAFALVLVSAALATPALAEPMTGKAAKKLLFAPVTAEVEILPEAGLSQDMADALDMVGEGQPYYGAVAIAPEEGLMSEATVAAANFHDTTAAGVAGCGVAMRWRSPISSPVSVSTRQPLIPEPPISTPNICIRIFLLLCLWSMVGRA